MAIADRINEMYTHVGDVYDTITNVDLPTNKNIQNIPQTIKDSYLEIMNNGIDRIWNNWEKVTGSGTSISLSPTLKAPMKNELKGNTSQTGTPTPTSPIPVNVVSGDNEIVVCGKNLYKGFSYSRTNNGVTYTYNEDGSANLSGTSTAPNSTSMATTTAIDNNYYMTLSAGTYTLSGGKTSIAVQLININPVTIIANTNDTKTFTLTEETNAYIRFQVSNGATVNTTIYPMLVKSSSASEYEPYQGNTYNIDLPVENLFDKANISWVRNNNADYSLSTDNSDTRIRTMTPIKLIGGKTYTLSGYPSSVSINSIKFYANLGDKTTVSTVNTSTFTVPTNATYVIFQFSGTGFTSATNTLMANANIMLQKGSKANTYTPYGTTPIELCKIGNYQDYFYKDSDKWYITNYYKKVIIDGTNTNLSAWSTPTQTNTLSFRLTSVEGIINNTTASTAILMLSNRYLYGIASNQGYLYSHDEEGFGTYYSNLYFRISKTIASTFETLKTWLSSNNLEVWYPLATPTNTEITDTTLINQLEEFYQAQSKNNQTNISQINNDLGFIISASALKKG